MRYLKFSPKETIAEAAENVLKPLLIANGIPQQTAEVLVLLYLLFYILIRDRRK